MSWVVQKQVEVENVELADRQAADLSIQPLDDAKKSKKVREEKVIACHCGAVYSTALAGNRTPDKSKPIAVVPLAGLLCHVLSCTTAKSESVCSLW